MNKTLIASMAALLGAATMLSSTAEAGLKFRIGIGVGFPIGGGFSRHDSHQNRHRRERVYVQRKAKRVYTATKKSSPATTAAKEEAPINAVAAQNENSSISVAALPAAVEDTSAATQPETLPQQDAAVAPTDAAPVDAAATDTPLVPVADQQGPAAPAPGNQKTAKKLDCKKFFPTAGVTLSVSCE